MAETPEARAARLRRLRANNPGYSAAKNRAYRARHPEKRAAHKAVENALAAGVIARRPCEACGADRVEAHHDDYSKPLKVRWLCRRHHLEAHRNSRSGQQVRTTSRSAFSTAPAVPGDTGRRPPSRKFIVQ